jgi:chromosome segregation ATPase
MQTGDNSETNTQIEIQLREEYETLLEARLDEINGLVLRQLELLAEVDELKARIDRTASKLAEVRAENKTLKQYDPVRMKRNLDGAKKKLVKMQKDNERLQGAVSERTKENVRLKQRVNALLMVLARRDSPGGSMARGKPLRDKAAASA